MTTSKNATAKRSSMLATIFFIVVGCVSLISVNTASALSGDDRAKAIAFYNNSIYAAGFVPEGWKIVKRNSSDGNFIKAVEFTNTSDFENEKTEEAESEKEYILALTESMMAAAIGTDVMVKVVHQAKSKKDSTLVSRATKLAPIN